MRPRLQSERPACSCETRHQSGAGKEGGMLGTGSAHRACPRSCSGEQGSNPVPPGREGTNERTLETA